MFCSTVTPPFHYKNLRLCKVKPHTYFQYVKIYITGRSGSKVGDNQIISQNVTIRNKSKGVIHMTAIATNPRSWCGVFLTAADWNKLRPRVKEMDVRYNVSGIREPDFIGVYFEAYVSETEANAIENELETL